MKVGDKVKVNGFSGVFVIAYIHEEKYRAYYAVTTQENAALLREWQTKDDLELLPTKIQVRARVEDLCKVYSGHSILRALREMLLRRIPPDEVLDMLNNINEYME